jgi:zinc protease
MTIRCTSTSERLNDWRVERTHVDQAYYRCMQPTNSRCTKRTTTALGVLSAVLLLGVLSGCDTTGGRGGAGKPSSQESGALKTTEFTLKNGMHLVVHEDHRVPTVKLSTRVGVGSADEPPGRGGFAHLFEHLMFMGTKAAPNFDVVMETVGGSNNAYTDYDETVFYESGPANALPTFVWLEADRFANLAAYMTKAKVDLQRNVVLNEMRQNVLDEPGGSAGEALNEGLFPPGHPYQRPVIGSIADLKAAKTADVVDFFNRYYRPSNLTMIVAGDVETTSTRNLIESSFRNITDRPQPKGSTPSFAKIDPKGSGSRNCFPCRTTQRSVDAVSNPQVNLAWATSSKLVDGSFANPALELAAVMLNDTYANAMEKHLVREQRLATSINVSYDPKSRAGFFFVDAEAAPGVAAPKLQAALEYELALIGKTGFEQSELDAAKVGSKVAIAEAFEEIGGRTDLLQLVISRYGSVKALAQFQHRFDDISLVDVRSAYNAMRRTSSLVVQTILPGERGDYPAILTRSSGQPTGILTNAPSAQIVVRSIDGKAKAVPVPKPSSAVLANGIKVAYFQRPDAPRTRMLLKVVGGSERDPAGQEGRAALLGEVMTRGAGKRNAEELTKALNLAGSDVSVSAGFGGYYIRLNAPVVNTRRALALAADITLRPRFESKELQLAVGESVASLQAAQTDPSAMAARASAEFYPKGHPFRIYPTIKSVKALRVDTMRAEHRAVFQPQSAEIIASGPIPLNELVDELNTAFKGWNNGGQPLKAPIDPPVQPTARKTLLVDIPAAAQSSISYFSTSVGPKDPKILAADTSSLILGGTFTSRLNRKLREEKGYTYGAGASLQTHILYGVASGSTSVETSVTGAAIHEFLGVLTNFRKGNITATETKTATSATYSQSLGLVATSSALVENLRARRDLGLRWETLGTELLTAASFTSADLNIGARDLLRDDAVLIVIAGDLSKVRPQLKGLNLGTISEVKPTV